MVRKFAAFAIGNAGFHSDYLYDDLRRSILPLVRNIGNHYGSTFGVGRKDENDGKTRSNAAAALVFPIAMDAAAMEDSTTSLPLNASTTLRCAQLVNDLSVKEIELFGILAIKPTHIRY